MKEFYINSDGIKLHAILQMPENKKKCPLLIVVHGLTGHMDEVHIKAAADTANEIGFASLRVEMYGHGKSEGKFEDHTLYKWINNMLDVVSYARTLDFVTDMYLCGHSQGGLLTVLIGGLLPDTFRAIIPLSAAVMIPEVARGGGILGMKFDPDHIPDILDFFGGKLNGNYLRTAQTIHVEEFVMKYRKPVLLVHGTRDQAVDVGYSYWLRQLYHDRTLVTVEGANHGFEGQICEMCAAIREFLLAQDSIR